MAEELQSIRLMGVFQNADFRCNERTLYEEFRKSPSFPGNLKKNQAYLFVSRQGTQLIWFVGSDTLGGTPDHPIVVINSRKWRIAGSHWNPKMLANYAAFCGLKLLGLPMFETSYKAKRLQLNNGGEHAHDSLFVTDSGVGKGANKAKTPKKPKQNERDRTPGRLRTRGRPRALIPRPTLAALPAP